METFIKLYDEAEDFVLTTAFRIRRSLSLLPRERRRRPRLAEFSSKPSTSPAR
jgi:hypothetical protein